MVDIVKLRDQVYDKKIETGQRWGQVFFNYFLTPGQQEYVIEHYPELYEFDRKFQFVDWLTTHLIDTDPIMFH